jgi:hypothetical protein
MPLPPALAAKLAKRGILQQSDTNAKTTPTPTTKSAEGMCVCKFPNLPVLDDSLLIVRESEAKLAEETAALKEKEEKLLEIKLKVRYINLNN